MTANQAARALAARTTGGLSAALERRLTLTVAAGAAALSMVASLPDALNYSFWQDEFASAHVILEPTLSGLLGHIARTESTPPAWYMLAWLVHHTGVTTNGLRLLSVLFAAGLAGLSVLYARRFVSLPGAALVGLFVAFGREFIRHSWELRSYEMFVLLCLVFAVTLEWTARSASRRRLITLAVVVALGSTTHYFFLFTLAAGLAWLWLIPVSGSVRRRVVGAAALGLLPLIAWSPWFAHQTAADHTRLLGGFSLSKLARTYPRMIASGFTPTPGWLVALNVTVDVLAVVGMVVLFRRGGRAALCALLAITPLVCGGVLSFMGLHILDIRNVFGSGPFVAVAVVAAIEAIPLRALARVAVAFALVVVVCGFVFEKEKPWMAPSNDIAGALVAEGWTGSAPIAVLGNVRGVVSPSGRGALYWYLPGQPDLAPVVPTNGACRSVFLIAGGSRRALNGLDSAQTIRVGRKYSVARLPWRPTLWRQLDADGARIYAWPAAHPACVRPR